jgi:uncharacterized protein YodC (DUF2158 family)
MKRPPRKSLMGRRPQAMPPEVERENQQETSMPREFITGDMVTLKSGGPPMTVEMQLTERTVRCVWFDGSREMVSIFDVDVLRPIVMSEPVRAASDYDSSEEGRE